MRADKFFATRFSSRTKAAEALEKGLILKNGKPLKPSDEVSELDNFTFLEAEERFVSNGGYKLSRGLREFSQTVSGEVFVDIGASTGGFTDCLLQNGVKKVYCVDVGESLLDPRIATDPRVVVMDRTNARYLTREQFSERIDGVVSDVSFISLKLIFPAISTLLSDGGRAFVLVKPQFEAGRDKIGKSGIVPKLYHPNVLKEIYAAAIENGLAPEKIVNAPLRERKNVEYILLLRKGGKPLSLSAYLNDASDFLENRV
jgi:23S rRNA (cytidine1920-2'-O)/16S rRNA (cytidine1409-2'-O)-methyltransferase